MFELYSHGYQLYTARKPVSPMTTHCERRFFIQTFSAHYRLLFKITEFLYELGPQTTHLQNFIYRHSHSIINFETGLHRLNSKRSVSMRLPLYHLRSLGCISDAVSIHRVVSMALTGLRLDELQPSRWSTATIKCVDNEVIR